MGSRTHEWPSRSSDLNLLDFYFRGYIKQNIYAEKPRTVENMKNGIREACNRLDRAFILL